MKRTGAEHVVEALEMEGITLSFGIPGTHNIELYDVLAASEQIRPVLVTDEQSASFMADGAWRAAGTMACVNVVPGAGLTHALSGIAEAFMDQVPMLVLGCGIRQDTGAAFQLHDVDQTSIVEPVVKGTFRPTRGEEIQPLIHRACVLARRPPMGPVFVEIPADLYLFRSPAGGPSTEEQPALPSASDAQVEKVARLLREARRPLVYFGIGALGARAHLLRLVERLEAPFSSTFHGKGVLPESHPLFLWPGFGDAAPSWVRKVAANCDLTLAVGCRFAEVGTGSYGIDPPRPLVHVDVDPGVPGRNVPADVAVTADAGAFLERLLAQLHDLDRPVDEGLRRKIRKGRRQLRDDWRSHSGDGVNPLRLMEGVQNRLGPETVFATDSGNGTFLAVEGLVLDRPRSFLAPVDYSCMGYAVPAALGAALAAPDRPVVALSGDGAFLMTGLELLTGVREKLGVVTVVLRDGELAQIAQFQGTALNRPVASQVPPYDAVDLARSLGLEGRRVGTHEELEEALDWAAEIAARGRPVLLDVSIDYSRKTFFTRGVVKTNLLRLPLPDRFRFLGRALTRRVTG